MRNTCKFGWAMALMVSSWSWAAGPAAAPSAASAPQSFVCKDGTTVQAATSQGACKGHKGIDKDATAAAAAKPQPKGKAGAAAGEKKADAAAVAPGGGPGKVWVNANSKVYHCHGDRHYGTTKNGSYMTEAEAKAQGMQASRNKTCS